MRFSLRTILLAFVIVGLALTTILSTWKLQRVEREIDRVRSAYGVGGPNRYEIMIIGDMGTQGKEGFYLVRAESPTEIRLLIQAYDGTNQTDNLDSIELYQNDFVEFALQYSVKYYGRAFRAFTVYPLKGNPTWLTVLPEPQGEERVFCYPVQWNGSLDDRPFLVYVFCPSELKDEPNFQWIGLDEIKLKAWCDKYKCQCVYFKFERLAK